MGHNWAQSSATFWPADHWLRKNLSDPNSGAIGTGIIRVRIMSFNDAMTERLKLMTTPAVWLVPGFNSHMGSYKWFTRFLDSGSLNYWGSVGSVSTPVGSATVHQLVADADSVRWPCFRCRMGSTRWICKGCSSIASASPSSFSVCFSQIPTLFLDMSPTEHYPTSNLQGGSHLL